MTEDILPTWLIATTVIIVALLALCAGILIIQWLTEPIEMTEEERYENDRSQRDNN